MEIKYTEIFSSRFLPRINEFIRDSEVYFLNANRRVYRNETMPDFVTLSSLTTRNIAEILF